MYRLLFPLFPQSITRSQCIPEANSFPFNCRFETSGQKQKGGKAAVRHVAASPAASEDSISFLELVARGER
jgi:hypothetical protein